MDDVLSTFRWVQQQAAEFGGNPSRIAICGESVGGNMAPATSMQLAGNGEQLPVFQVCVYPVTTGAQFGESMEDAADGRPLNRALLWWMAMHEFFGAAAVLEKADDAQREVPTTCSARSAHRRSTSTRSRARRRRRRPR
jgi:acetyl esterase/lipase